MSEAQQGVNVYGHQNSGGGPEWYADKVIGGEGVSVGVQCGWWFWWIKQTIVNKLIPLVCIVCSCGLVWIKQFIGNEPIPLVCTVHWVSVCSDSPGDDKNIANLFHCREWGKICNLFALYNFLRWWTAGVLCHAGVHSISFNDLNICKLFSFSFCLFPFFFQTLNLLPIPLLLILIFYSLQCFLLDIPLSIIFPLIDLMQFDFSINRTICMSGD